MTQPNPTPERIPLDVLSRFLKPLKGYEGTPIRHIKTGGRYLITSVHFRVLDMSIWFTYETLKDHYKTMNDHDVTFSRPIGELFDGRFILEYAPVPEPKKETDPNYILNADGWCPAMEDGFKPCPK